ncbi:MAG: iron-sulfur cluster assembly scaffold protein [Promethearchaeota archaeon]
MMENNFDKFVNKLQKKIIKKEIEDHNNRIVSLFHNPKNWGKPPNNDITISHTERGKNKELMQFFLKIEDDIIVKAHFITDGCGVMVATGSQATLLIENKSIDYVKNINPDDIDKALNGLTQSEKHCA